MAEPIVWSAVNISEGRNFDGLRELARGLEECECGLANWSADGDHHRSVFSLVGTADRVSHGIEKIFEWAETHLDLSRHQGAHPRLGAVDVVPFVPLSSDATLRHAQEVATRSAARVAERFDVPIFLYRDSTPAANPLTLPELRRGGAERLRERMRAGELRPDFGPGSPHPALGVSVFGARPPLTAFNCLLDTEDLEAGRSIAREIRASEGGIPHLQALAFKLDSRGGRVQISMNILDPKETPPHLAYLAVKEACQKRGLRLLSSELIGLVPLQALEDAFRHFLQLESFQSGQTAEWNLLEKSWKRTRRHETG